MSTKKKIFIALAAFMVLVLLAKGGSRFFHKAEAMGVIKVPVTAEPVQRKLVEETLELTGDVRGMNEARIYPKVPGRLLRKIKDAGDTVKKGEVVALIDRDEPALKFAAALCLARTRCPPGTTTRTTKKHWRCGHWCAGILSRPSKKSIAW